MFAIGNELRDIMGEIAMFMGGPVTIGVVSFFVAAAVFSVHRSRTSINRKQGPKPIQEYDYKLNQVNLKRELGGDWTPEKFVYPPVKACSQEPMDMKPIPYRPFLWGKYHVTMGIRSMLWDEWIELDNQFERYHRIREHRIRTRGNGAICVLDDNANPGVVRGGEEAAVELVHELAEYLSRRYPSVFRVVRHSCQPPLKFNAQAHCDWGWDGALPIKSITIVPLNLTYYLPLSMVDGHGAPERAMEIAALLIQDDLALMIEGSDGRYYFQAGAICVPGFWRIQDKIGLPLDEIHLSGNVPHYREKLHTSLERFFRRLPVNKPVIRNNYFFQLVSPPKNGNQESSNVIGEELFDTEELAWALTSNGPEDKYKRGHAFAHPEDRPAPTPETIRMRSERQTLRRLPYSGAVVFTIRTYLYPVEMLGHEPGIPGRLASSMRAWTEEVGRYKGRETGGWWDVLMGYLDECHLNQVKRGEVEEGGTVAQDGGYPY